VLKKLFDWTPSDIAQWEKIHTKGLRHFIIWYGIQLFGGMLFLLLGGAVFLGWVKENKSTDIAALGLELLFILAACFVGGIITSLLTWAVEENIYQKIQATTKPGKTGQHK
jgi:hypothetical protein